MAKTPTRPSSSRTKRPSKKKAAAKGSRAKATSNGKSGAGTGSATGKHLVIVESPAKARTINKYLGPGFIVQASVGHVRDLPSKAPKGTKQPVPGVDLEHDFEPTYEVLPGKKKVVSDLKRAAKQAEDVWFATDLDREGEAIAWHLAQELGIDPKDAKRVVFNAITREEIQRAFANPHSIDEDRVNAQQARRILDRIVGYQVSPLLWKKVARGLSAGRVQSVAVRLIVEREREIQAFVPDEYWRVTGRFVAQGLSAVGSRPSAESQKPTADGLAKAWREYMAKRDEKNKSPTLKAQNAWLAEHHAFKAELVEVAGEKFDLRTTKDEARDLSNDVKRITDATGLTNIRVSARTNPEGKGPAKTLRTVEADLAPGVLYRVKSIETKRTTSKPNAPFITSTLQMAASSALGMGAGRTMRIAQALYENGYITYMRTDSTNLSGEAIGQARSYIKKTHGDRYLPEKPNVYGSRETAQEAHEAIRPTDAATHPDTLAKQLKEEELKVYRLIWNRFIACQMVPAEWDSTAILLERADKPTGAVFRATGRILVFDGFYRVAGVPTASDEQKLPALRDQGNKASRHQETAANAPLDASMPRSLDASVVAPFSIEPEQLFTSPPPRYTEASLVKTLEAEGIGRPSTYASIIQVIQDRNYVEQIDRRFYATDLGEVVTDKLMQGFPRIMEIGYTRDMEEVLDRIANQHIDWRDALRKFYARFSEQLEHAHETMTHAKAEMEPAIYACPVCGSKTCYRFGKGGRFLSCTAYPDCDYAAPIDREGTPQLPERVNVACPDDGSPMVLRTGRFGKFLASVNYPEVKCVINLDKKERIKLPSPPPLLTDLECPKCASKMNLRSGKRGPWLGCSKFPKCRGRLAWTKVDEKVKDALVAELAEHDKKNPQITLHSLDGKVIPEGTPLVDLLIPGGAAKLEVHPDADCRPEAA